MIVLTFPGQGSQKPGFLGPWLVSPQHRGLLERLGEAAEVDLIRHGTESDADTIRDTAIAQPLIVAAGILTWEALREDAELAAGIAGVAGHSVGEITAAYAAGIFDAETAIRFVALRARAMAEDSARVRTSMSAVLGGEQQEVEARLAQLDLTPANYNGGGQIVAAGLPEALAELAAEPPARSRVVPLQVAGAFHTRFMAQAQAQLDALREQFPVADPQRAIWTNADGTRVDTGAQFLQLLIEQVARPVRWDLIQESFAESQLTGLLEAAPAGTLTGLAKRALRGTPSVAINSPDDLVAARELVLAA